MDPVSFALVVLAGACAGLINTVVGSGTLITFPTLLALGITPVVANTSNSVGLVAGGVSGTMAMAGELKGQRARMVRLGAASALGGITGALLLLVLPPSAFRAIVPVLIGLGCVLVVVQPTIARRVARRHAGVDQGGDAREPWWLVTGVGLSGVYGGYFGAAQGVILIGLLGTALLHESMARLNAVKNGLATIVNGIAAVVFIVVSILGGPPINWWAALAVGLGSIVGARLGASIGRRLPPIVYRVVIVLVGIAAIVNLLARG